MMLIPIAFAAIRSPEHVKWTLGAYVLGALASSLYGLLVPTAATSIDVGRLTGTVGDANTTAIVAVAAVPLLVALVAISKRSALVKSAAAVAMVILFASLVSTLSREGLVALGLVLVGGVVFGGRWRAGMAVLLIVGVAATGGYYFVLAPLSARNRVTSSNTSGRSSLYTIAFRVFETHPVLGVGMDNFPLVEGRYVDLPGAITRADDVIDTPKEAHDAALETLAELGVPGLVTLLLAWGGALLIGIRAAKLFERLGRTDMELISRSVVLALVAVFTGDAFGPAQFGKYLWILLALCPVLLSMARREARKRTPPRRAAVPART
jgi:O-antigen ligase